MATPRPHPLIQSDAPCSSQRSRVNTRRPCPPGRFPWGMCLSAPWPITSDYLQSTTGHWGCYRVYDSVRAWVCVCLCDSMCIYTQATSVLCFPLFQESRLKCCVYWFWKHTLTSTPFNEPPYDLGLWSWCLKSGEHMKDESRRIRQINTIRAHCLLWSPLGQPHDLPLTVTSHPGGDLFFSRGSKVKPPKDK